MSTAAIQQLDLSQMLFLGLTAQTWITIGLSSLSLMISAMTFIRFRRTRTEPSWTLCRFTSTPVGMFPRLADLGHGDMYEIAELVNNGDGEGFDIHAFGHECVVRMYEWERSGDSWSCTEVSQWDRGGAGAKPMWIVVWPKAGETRISDDAKICVHWVSSPTRLRQCAYSEMWFSDTAAWWQEWYWFPPYRLACRMVNSLTHLRFHVHPTDARRAPAMMMGDRRQNMAAPSPGGKESQQREN